MRPKIYTERIEASVAPEMRGKIDALTEILQISTSAVTRQVMARGIAAIEADLATTREAA